MNNTLSFDPLSMDQAKYLTCVWSDKNVIKYTDIDTPCSVEQINNLVADLKDHDVFTVRNKLTIIGVVGCIPENDKQESVFNMIFYFCRACWNHGYATDSVKWLICYMKRKYENLIIYADVIAENIASEKILLGNGFKMVSEEPYEKQNISSVKRRYILENK